MVPVLISDRRVSVHQKCFSGEFLVIVGRKHRFLFFSDLTLLERSMRVCTRCWSTRSRSRTWTCARCSSRTSSSRAVPRSSRALETDFSLKWRNWLPRTSRSGSQLPKNGFTQPGLEAPSSPPSTLSRRCGCPSGSTTRRDWERSIAKPSSGKMWTINSWFDQMNIYEAASIGQWLAQQSKPNQCRSVFCSWNAFFGFMWFNKTCPVRCRVAQTFSFLPESESPNFCLFGQKVLILRQPCTVQHNSESHIYLLQRCTGVKGQRATNTALLLFTWNKICNVNHVKQTCAHFVYFRDVNQSLLTGICARLNIY